MSCCIVIYYYESLLDKPTHDNPTRVSLSFCYVIIHVLLHLYCLVSYVAFADMYFKCKHVRDNRLILRNSKSILKCKILINSNNYNVHVEMRKIEMSLCPMLQSVGSVKTLTSARNVGDWLCFWGFSKYCFTAEISKHIFFVCFLS